MNKKNSGWGKRLNLLNFFSQNKEVEGVICRIRDGEKRQYKDKNFIKEFFKNAFDMFRHWNLNESSLRSLNWQSDTRQKIFLLRINSKPFRKKINGIERQFKEWTNLVCFRGGYWLIVERPYWCTSCTDAIGTVH